MKILKRLTITCLTLALCLTGCGKKGENELSTEDAITAPRENVTDDSASTKEETENRDETNQAVDQGMVTNNGYVIPALDMTEKDIPDTDSMRFSQSMEIGWNLGNTLDASVDQPWFEDELDYESAWCGVKTTPELIKAVKDAGFHTVRIPVSWHNHVSGDNYEISAVWMDRVQEVVDYAIELDMYVILDTHHDIFSGNEENALGQCFLYPSDACYASSEKYLTCVWQQICERFKDYDEHLIFESMNEPRLTGTEYEWWLDPSSSACQEAIACINKLNQSFVDVVRSSGGKNAERYLLIPGYGSSFDGANHENFVLPQDTVSDRLMVSVHAYTPYNFALQAETEGGSKNSFDVNNSADTQEIDYIMNTLYDKYVSKGIPVIIDEFGARNKSSDSGSDNIQARVNFSAYYVAAARANGITCCWWDNNSFHSTGEEFGLIDRQGLVWVYSDVLHAIMEY